MAAAANASAAIFVISLIIVWNDFGFDAAILFVPKSQFLRSFFNYRTKEPQICRGPLNTNSAHIRKYSASVSSALFLSSSQSPAISSRSSTMIRSPVSNSFGSSCRRKPPTLPPSCLHTGLGGGQGAVFSGSHGGGGGGFCWGGFDCVGLGGGCCLATSCTRLRR